MDQCAILECDDRVTEASKLDVIAKLAAHGIDAVMLPVGMTVAMMSDGDDPFEGEE